MRIQIRGGGGERPPWAERLATRLERRGHHVATRFGGEPASRPGATSLALIFAMERLLYGATLPPADAQAGRRDAQGPADDAYDVVIDLDGKALDDPVDTPTYVPLYDGAPGEMAAVGAVVDGRAPRLTLALREPGDAAAHNVATALPALEEPRVLTYSLGRVQDRMALLVAQSVDQARPGRVSGQRRNSVEPAFASGTGIGRGMRFIVEGFTAKLARRLTRLVSTESHWRIGYRWADGDDISANLAWPASPYAFVPDDAQRYYADPFVFWHDGMAHVFCEEFPYATGKGILSVFTVGRDRTPGKPHIVLERPYHLSYPMIFARDGAIFMIPETTGNRTIELYRATRFPDAWELEAVLVEDVSAADATLLERDGRLWLFAALADEGASSWDALGLFHAEKLAGPWTPHPANPVLVDAASARPAGMMFERDGALMRPAQDCTGGYGSALTLCRVDQLDGESYSQTLQARLVAQPGWSAEGVHTLNMAGGLEVIDSCGWRSRRAVPTQS